MYKNFSRLLCTITFVTVIGSADRAHALCPLKAPALYAGTVVALALALLANKQALWQDRTCGERFALLSILAGGIGYWSYTKVWPEEAKKIKVVEHQEQ